MKINDRFRIEWDTAAWCLIETRQTKKRKAKDGESGTGEREIRRWPGTFAMCLRRALDLGASESADLSEVLMTWKAMMGEIRAMDLPNGPMGAA